MGGSGTGTPVTVPDTAYVSVSEADVYFAGRLNTAVWDAATAGDKLKALNMATKAIDKLPLSGKRYQTVEEGQTLEFPRTYLNNVGGWSFDEDDYDEDTDTLEVPQEVLDACCEIALALLSYYASSVSEDRGQLQAWGVTEITIGEVREKYGSGGSISSKEQYIEKIKSPEAFNLLERYISVSGAIG